MPKGKRLCIAKLHFRIDIHCSFFVQCVNTFVDELQWEETDSAKCDEIHELKLTSEEWESLVC